MQNMQTLQNNTRFCAPHHMVLIQICKICKMFRICRICKIIVNSKCKIIPTSVHHTTWSSSKYLPSESLSPAAFSPLSSNESPPFPTSFTTQKSFFIPSWKIRHLAIKNSRERWFFLRSLDKNYNSKGPQSVIHQDRKSRVSDDQMATPFSQ